LKLDNNDDDIQFTSSDNDVKLITFVAPFHLIDHGSILYLILLQVLLYNQQYVSTSGLAVIHAISFTVGDTYNVTSTITMKTILYEFYTYAMTSAVTLKTSSYELDTNEKTAAIMQIYSSSSSAIYDEDSSAAVTLKMISYKLDADKMFHEISFTALSMKTVSYALPSYDIDTESSAVSVANEATFSTIIPGDLSPSSYSLSLLRNNDTAVTSKTSPYELIAIEITAPAVMKTTHDMSYDTTVPITDK